MKLVRHINCTTTNDFGRRYLCAVLVLAVLLIGGCQKAWVDSPLTQTLSGNDPDTQLEFWHQLADRPVTSNDEAFHGLILFMEEQDPAEDYAGRVDWLKQRQMLPKLFDSPANAAMERGTIAVTIVRYLEIKGGLVMRVIGPRPRYATRELLHMNLLPPSSPHQTLSGSEFMGVIGRIEDYQRIQQRRQAGGRSPQTGNGGT